jgi:siroheme synthase-like protein
VLIIATNINQLNIEIYQLAQTKNILTNVVDNPALCDFYTAAVMTKGAIKIAVSSNGASPTLAKRLRDILEEVIPDEVEDTAELLKKVRSLLKGNLESKIKTLNLLTTVLNITSNPKEKLVVKGMDK